MSVFQERHPTGVELFEALDASQVGRPADMLVGAATVALVHARLVPQRQVDRHHRGRWVRPEVNAGPEQRAKGSLQPIVLDQVGQVAEPAPGQMHEPVIGTAGPRQDRPPGQIEECRAASLEAPSDDGVGLLGDGSAPEEGRQPHQEARRAGDVARAIDAREPHARSFASAASRMASPRKLDPSTVTNRAARGLRGARRPGDASPGRRAEQRFAQTFSWSRIGRRRIRLPVAAKIALQSAGGIGGTPGSPTPPSGKLKSPGRM